VAGVVPPPGAVGCPGPVWDFEADLGSADEASRYAAIKTAGVRGTPALASQLAAVANDPSEDWRVRLEGMASAARLAPDEWVQRIARLAEDVDQELAAQMEAVLILSEIPAPVAADGLERVARHHTGRHEEVRCAAVWGLGMGSCSDPVRLLDFVTDPTDRVALHAAGAMRALPDAVARELARGLHRDDDRAAAVAAAILAQHERVDLLLAAATEPGSGRLWALRALGDVAPEQVAAAAGVLPEAVRQALAPIWIQHRDWLRSDANDGALRSLTAQQIRFDPAGPFSSTERGSRS
jgi:hypothetical protein